MCLLCQTDINEFVNLITLNCNNCPLLTSIPDTLVDLRDLGCHNCPKLTSIPNNLVNLRAISCYECPELTSIPNSASLIELFCWGCPNLSSIPDTLVNLRVLNCNNCPKLTYIPDTLVNLTELNCTVCPYLFLTDNQKLLSPNHLNVSEPKYTVPKVKMIMSFKKEYLIKMISWKLGTDNYQRSRFSPDIARIVVQYLF